jgi:hypothetical protein
VITRDDNSHQRPIRRLRIDECRPASVPETPEQSGRRIVIAAFLASVVFVGVLTLTFMGWRSRYLTRASFGITQVGPAIAPLAQVVPAGVDPEAWQGAVNDTRRALIAVTASNLLSFKEMGELRKEVSERVARAHPETAVDELSDLWDELTARAGPVLDPDYYLRPKLLPPRRRVPETHRAGAIP